jgi:arginase family enzyme
MQNVCREKNMKNLLCLAAFIFVVVPLVSSAQSHSKTEGKMKIFIVKNRTEGPAVIERGGLLDRLSSLGCDVVKVAAVQLTPEEENEYGEWNQEALESKHLGQLIAENRKDEYFTVGLLTNCTDLLGMLAGLQHLKPGQISHVDSRGLQSQGLAGQKPLRVGLIWIDAHADFNTPETTLSGMLGGMPVAIASGMCLTRLRLKAGLDPALPTKYIVMAGLRDVDPLEQELLDRSQCQFLSVDDIRNISDNIDRQMDRLSRLTDIIYVHIDMDVLDPSEVSGHPLTAPEGPTSHELAAALEAMFRHEKAGAIGIASMPFGKRDKDGLSLQAAYRLIEGAIKGIKKR